MVVPKLYGLRLKTLISLSAPALVLILLIIMILQIVSVYAQNPWQERHRPLVGGIQIQISGICSIGFPAYYMTSTSTIYGFISAGHCGYLQASAYQPIYDNNNYVGYVEKINHKWYNSTDRKWWMHVDMLFVKTEEKSGGEKPTTIAPRILFLYDSVRGNIYAEIVGTQIPEPGMAIWKVGRTTGPTSGEIKSVSGLFRTDGVIVYPTIVATARAEQGDSGGPAFRVSTVFDPNLGVIYYAYIAGTVIGIDLDDPNLFHYSSIVKMYDDPLLRNIIPHTSRR